MGYHRRRPDDQEKWVFSRIAESPVRRRRPKLRDVLVAAITHGVLVVVILLAGAAIIAGLASRAGR
jgi:hypothetical protein